MLLFTIKKGSLPKTAQGQKGLPQSVEFAFYFNVLGAIVLAGPNEQFSNQTCEGKAEDFGVDAIRGELDMDKEEDGGEIDEPFL